MEDELAQVVATGIAWDNEEHAEGICAEGATIIDPIGRLFALSIPMMTACFAARRAQVGIALNDACRELLGDLGAI